MTAKLTMDFSYRTDRPTYHPGLLSMDTSGWKISPVPWHGSPDLRGVTRANAFVIIPPGDHKFRAGAELEVLAVEL